MENKSTKLDTGTTAQTDANTVLCEGVIAETKLEWKMFLRKNGMWSIWHLCDKDNKCKCGWEYKKKEFTKVKVEKEMPDFAVCNFCVKGITDESIIRIADVL